MGWRDLFWKSKSTDETKKKLVSQRKVAADYKRSTVDFLGLYSLDKLPPFTLFTADLMLRDPQVMFGLMVRNGGLLQSEVEITGENQQEVEFVKRQWERIWNNYASHLLRAKRWGCVPFEVTFRQEAGEFGGWIGVDELHDFHPRDARVLTREGDVCGFRLMRLQKTGQAILESPSALWVTYQAETGNPYGKSLNYNAYGPWWEKWMDRGGKQVLRLRMIKDAYSGDVFQGPNDLVEMQDGSTVPRFDLFRAAVEARLSGSPLFIPDEIDEQGNSLIKYSPPTDNGKPDGILEWNERLDWDIWKGQGVFREVFEAATSGSGYSGRSIPMVTFLSTLGEEFRELLHCVDRDVLRPLTHINMGRKPTYAIRPKSLIETFTDDMAGTNMGGGAMGGTQGRVPGQQQHPPQPGQGQPSSQPPAQQPPIPQGQKPSGQFAEDDPFSPESSNERHDRTIQDAQEALSRLTDWTRSRANELLKKNDLVSWSLLPPLEELIKVHAKYANSLLYESLIAAGIVGMATVVGHLRKSKDAPDVGEVGEPSDDSSEKSRTSTLEPEPPTPRQANVFTPTPSTPLPPPPNVSPPISPPLPPPADSDGLSPDPEPPSVRFPELDSAVNELRRADLFTSEDYLEVAREAQDGAFAITGDLEENTLNEMRLILSRNLQEGADAEAFVNEVDELIVNRGGLSETHLHQVFRTNMQAKISDSMERTLNKPLIVDFFQYRAYFATTDERTRKNHLALERMGLNGTNLYNKDDPVWHEFRSPWDYNCFIPGTVCEGTFDEASRMFYDGDVVELRTRNGKRITVTPNHPVLTENGFVLAGDIQQGDKVVCDSGHIDNGCDSFGREKPGSLRALPSLNGVFSHPSEDVDYTPTKIEEIFEAFSLMGSLMRVPVSGNDFYGDGKFGKGYIDVVRPDCELWRNRDPSILECTGDLRLPFVDIVQEGLASNSHLLELVVSSHSSTASIMGCPELSFDSAGSCLDALPFEGFRFGSSSGLDVGVNEPIPDGTPGYSKLLGETQLRLPSQVFLDDVVAVERYPFFGHVYDLSSKYGIIIANGIVTSNCRCSWAPVSVRDAAAKGVTEAKEWWGRAVEMAAKEGGKAAMYLHLTAPESFQFVPHPPFNAPEAFQRGTVDRDTGEQGAAE